MPSKIADTVYIGGHEGHDLGLGGKIILILIFGIRFSGWCVLVTLVPRWGIRTGGSKIFSDQGLGKQDGIELDAQPDL